MPATQQGFYAPSCATPLRPYRVPLPAVALLVFPTAPAWAELVPRIRSRFDSALDPWKRNSATLSLNVVNLVSSPRSVCSLRALASSSSFQVRASRYKESSERGKSRCRVRWRVRRCRGRQETQAWSPGTAPQEGFPGRPCTLLEIAQRDEALRENNSGVTRTGRQNDAGGPLVFFCLFD
jgi:hypothetical protein